MKVLKAIIGAALLLAMTAAVTGAAQAHVVARGDYNDSPSPLDIESTGFLHTSELYVGGIATHGAFRNAMLGIDGDAYVDLDSFGDREADYYVQMTMINGELKARLYRYSGSSSDLIGRGVAWRPTTSIVMFAIRQSSIRRGSGYIRWSGSTRYERGVDAYGKTLNWWDETGWKTHTF